MGKQMSDNQEVVRQKKNILEIILWIVLSIIIILSTTLIILNRVVFFSVYVDGPSMLPTLQSGDVLYVSKNYEVKEGDIIVIDGEKENIQKTGYEWIIKRAIAVGEKDVVKIVEIKDGKVFVGYENQTLIELKEDYLAEGTQTTPNDKNKISRWEIREGEVFYLGDNREDSKDSRSEYGTCEISQVKGVVSDWALSARALSGCMYKISDFFTNLFGR